MNRTITWMTGALAALTLPLFATSMRNPVSGYVFDGEKGEIRPLNGLPGAALIGAPVEAPQALAKVFFGPRQAAALAVSREGSVFYVTFEGAKANFTELPDFQLTPDLAAFAPDGLTAIAYQSSTREYRLLEGLPSAPRAGETKVLSDVTGDVVALALDSRTLALAVRGSDSTAIYALRLAGGALSFITNAASVDSLSFSTRGVLLVADAGASRVLTATPAGGVWSLETVADERDDVTGILGAEFASDAIAILTSSEIVLRQAGEFRRLPLPAATARLAPMAASGVLYLDARAETLGALPLHLLDVSGDARIVFVPAGGAQ